LLVSRPARPYLVSLLFAALAVGALLPVSAVPARATGNAEFVAEANSYRSRHGVAALSTSSLLDRIAVERSGAMARAGGLNHDLDLVKRRLAEGGVCFRALGENVAANGSGSVNRFVEQWYASTRGHREILLAARYTHAAGSWTGSSDGQAYAAMIFVELCDGVSAPTETGGFVDTAASAFEREIRWLVDTGITSGCAAGRFCPRSAVTREQMASFIRRATGLPSSTSTWFTDIAASEHRADINGIAVARIAAGCSDARYCPDSRVTREQMASFLVRALDLPRTSKDYFADDNGSPHEAAINSLAAAGVTGGCASGRYCPSSGVTREQMAGFLFRAFAP
jgi:uncharacterized protein YkwD